MISELGRIESETDELLGTACRCLFGMKAELGIATVYCHQLLLLLLLAGIADFSERAGNRLCPFVAR